MGYILRGKKCQKTLQRNACLYAMFETLIRKLYKDGSGFSRAWHSELIEILYKYNANVY